MSSIKHALGKLDLAMGPGLIGIGVDAGVGYGASYAIGRAYAQYGKTNWAARNGATLAASIGKGLAVVAAVMGAPQIVTGVLNAAGQAGIHAHGLNKGLQHGRDKAGKRAVLIDKTAALPPGADLIGLKAGRSGASPSWEQVAEMAGLS